MSVTEREKYPVCHECVVCVSQGVSTMSHVNPAVTVTLGVITALHQPAALLNLEHTEY